MRLQERAADHEQLDRRHASFVDRVAPQRLDRRDQFVVVEVRKPPGATRDRGADDGHRCAVVLEIALEVGLLAFGAFRITPVDQQHVDLIRQRGVVHRSRNPAVAKLL